MFYTLTCDVCSPPPTHACVDMCMFFRVGGIIVGLMHVFICGPLVSNSLKSFLLHSNVGVDRI